jgi:hypothetical protein
VVYEGMENLSFGFDLLIISGFFPFSLFDFLNE